MAVRYAQSPGEQIAGVTRMTDAHVWRRATARGGVRYGKVERQEERFAAQLRTGHCALLQAYLHSICVAATPACTRCGAERDDTDHFLLACPAHAGARAETIGPGADVTVLAREPEKVAAFLRRSGRIEAAEQAWAARKEALRA
eukprot:gene2847-biopygen4400